MVRDMKDHQPGKPRGADESVDRADEPCHRNSTAARHADRKPGAEQRGKQQDCEYDNHVCCNQQGRDAGGNSITARPV